MRKLKRLPGTIVVAKRIYRFEKKKKEVREEKKNRCFFVYTNMPYHINIRVISWINKKILNMVLWIN